MQGSRINHFPRWVGPRTLSTIIYCVFPSWVKPSVARDSWQDCVCIWVRTREAVLLASVSSLSEVSGVCCVSVGAMVSRLYVCAETHKKTSLSFMFSRCAPATSTYSTFLQAFHQAFILLRIGAWPNVPVYCSSQIHETLSYSLFVSGEHFTHQSFHSSVPPRRLTTVDSGRSRCTQHPALCVFTCSFYHPHLRLWDPRPRLCRHCPLSRYSIVCLRHHYDVST